jgi:hypothetical protein
MLEWIGAEGERMDAAFERVFRGEGTPFGSPALHWGGLHDGNEGVQWNMGFDPDIPERWIGVNLEGLKYDGWPIARLVRKEQQRATLPSLVASHPELAGIRLILERDYWTGRNRGHVERIADLLLRDLTEAAWRRVLADARNSLAAPTGGRGIRMFTPKSGGPPRESEVTPHLTFRLSVPAVESWEQFIRAGIDLLDPLYEWACERASA